MIVSLVITGTDTGVGKTVITAALARILRERKYRVAVIKPVETGCEGEELRPADGLMLAAEAGWTVVDKRAKGKEEETLVPLEDVVPWRFRAPLAPQEAARRERRKMTLKPIYQALERWRTRADIILVETAGGLLVPLAPGLTSADLITQLRFPVIVVAPNRLGVINHTLLTAEALARRKLSLEAVILNNLSPHPDESASSNARLIAEHAGARLFEVPFAPNDPVGTAAAVLRPVLSRIFRMR